MDGKCGDADAAGEQRMFIVEGHQFRQHRQGGDAVSKSLGCAERSFHRGVRKDQRKFFSTIACRKIAGWRDAPAGALLAVQQPAQFTKDLIAHRMAIHVINLLEVVEIDEEEREWTHGSEGQGAELGQRFLEVGMIVEAGQAVPDRLVAQQLVGLHEVAIGARQFLDEAFGFHLLAFDCRNVRDGFDDVHVTGRRLDLRPLHEEVLVVREGNLAGGWVSRVHGFRHLAKCTRCRAAGDLFMTSQVGNIAELVLGHLVLEHDLVGGGIDHRDDDRLRVEQHLWIVLEAFQRERHRRRVSVKSLNQYFSQTRFGQEFERFTKSFATPETTT